MPSYIFYTSEGYTYQPYSESIEPDIENLQVIGFASGDDDSQALRNLIAENPYLLETTFNSLTCLELKHDDYFAHATWFNLGNKSIKAE
jgi:hypothetical protein